MSSETEAMSGGKRFLIAYNSDPFTTPFNNGIAFQTLGHFEFIQPQGALTLEFMPDTMTIAPQTDNDTLAAPEIRLVAYGQTSTTPTPFTTPTPPSGVGGLVVLTCNEECNSHAQCPANHFCSSGRCRNTACSSSANCVCTTPTPGTSTVATPTPRATPRATPTTALGGLDDSSKGFDPLSTEEASLAARMDNSPTPSASAAPVSLGDSDGGAFTFTPAVIAGMIGAGLFLLILMLVALRRRKGHDEKALNSLGMMVHSTQPAQQKMAEVVEQPVIPVASPSPEPETSSVEQVVSETPVVESEPPQPSAPTEGR